MAVIFSGNVFVSATASVTGSIYGDFSGPVSPQIGVAHKTVTANTVFTKLVLHTLLNVDNDITVTVNINGEAVSVITLASGANTQTNSVNITMTTLDYMTLDITSGTCENLSVRLDY